MEAYQPPVMLVQPVDTNYNLHTFRDLCSVLCSPSAHQQQCSMATAHLLETSEEDSFLLVARFVGDLLIEGAVRALIRLV